MFSIYFCLVLFGLVLFWLLRDFVWAWLAVSWKLLKTY